MSQYQRVKFCLSSLGLNSFVLQSKNNDTFHDSCLLLWNTWDGVSVRDVVPILEFLRKLDALVHQYSPDVTTVLFALRQTLKGLALSWYRANSESFKGYVDFRDEFVQCFVPAEWRQTVGPPPHINCLCEVSDMLDVYDVLRSNGLRWDHSQNPTGSYFIIDDDNSVFEIRVGDLNEQEVEPKQVDLEKDTDSEVASEKPEVESPENTSNGLDVTPVVLEKCEVKELRSTVPDLDTTVNSLLTEPQLEDKLDKLNLDWDTGIDLFTYPTGRLPPKKERAWCLFTDPGDVDLFAPTPCLGSDHPMVGFQGALHRRVVLDDCIEEAEPVDEKIHLVEESQFTLVTAVGQEDCLNSSRSGVIDREVTSSTEVDKEYNRIDKDSTRREVCETVCSDVVISDPVHEVRLPLLVTRIGITEEENNIKLCVTRCPVPVDKEGQWKPGGVDLLDNPPGFSIVR